MGRRLFEDTPAVQTAPAVNTTVFANQQPFQAPLPVKAAVPAAPTHLMRIVSEADVDTLVAGRPAQNTAVVNRMMEITKVSAVDEISTSLNEAIVIAKGLDPDQMAKLGFIGRLTGWGASVKEKFEERYQTFEERLDKLVVENAKHVTLQESRIEDIDELYESNRQLCLGYEEDQVAAKATLDALNAQFSSLDGSADVFAAQDKHRVKAAISRVERFMFDTQSLIQKAHQRAPKLDDMKENARSLVHSMNLIQDRLIPDLKETYTDFILNLEQKKTADAANALYDVHDDVTRKGADMHRKNVEGIAALTERPVIKTETLRYTQKQYLDGAQAALEIHEKGRQARIAGLAELKALDDELIAHANKSKN